MRCQVCGSDSTKLVCVLPLKIPGGKIADQVAKCLSCGTFFRTADFSDSQVQSHFVTASYTAHERQEYWYESRKRFLRHIAQLANSFVDLSSADAAVLDVGCSYGHLLDIFQAQGVECFGLEIVDELGANLAKKGHRVYRSIHELEEKSRFDAITFIDSLYYFQDPAKILNDAKAHLKDHGIVILRVTNRTPILSLYTLFNLPIPYSLFGDAKHNFSYKGLKYLIESCDYTIAKVVLNEKGKKMPINKTWAYYKVSLVISHLFKAKLTPGIILICALQ